MALNEVVAEELGRVHAELQEQVEVEQADTDAKRWRMKYKYKYYYKYKAKADEEAGVSNTQVLGDLWDIDPAVAHLEGPDAVAATAVVAAPTSPPKAGQKTVNNMLQSPPQLGRGEEWDYAVGEGDSPVGAGDLGEVEFFVPTEEIDEEPIMHIAGQSKRQADFFQQKLHSTGLQEKSFRSKTVPLQRGMRKETDAWKDVLNIVREKGAEEVKNALSAKDVLALTSANVKQAVQFLAKALEVKNLVSTPGRVNSPSSASSSRGAQRTPPPWDTSKTPEGRYRYLKRLEKVDAETVGRIKMNPSLKSPEKVGWDHDKYFRMPGARVPAEAMQ